MQFNRSINILKNKLIIQSLLRKISASYGDKSNAWPVVNIDVFTVVNDHLELLIFMANWDYHFPAGIQSVH